MRWKLLWNPGLALERLGYMARQRRRLRRLRGTVAEHLAVGHIESLELLDAAKPLGIRTIYDIGANVGTWTLLAKAIIPDASIAAFEPLSEHCTEFTKAMQNIEGVSLHPITLGAESKSASLRVMNFSDASSLMSPASRVMDRFRVEEVRQVSVEMRRLDDYRLERRLNLPDLMKLDVQGYELEVLKGASECLRSTKALVIEVSLQEFYEKQCLLHDLVGHLAQHGFFLSVLGEHTPTGAPLSQMDALFIKGRE